MFRFILKFHLLHVPICLHAVDTKPPADLESVFFDLEMEMENNLICRDQVCLSEVEERRK